MTFAQQLKAERTRVGKTQAEVAAILEVSKRSVEQWEAGSEPLKVTQEGVLARMKRQRVKA